MTKRAIRIGCNADGLVTWTLKDIILQIRGGEDLFWDILSFQGYWNHEKHGSILDFESSVESSPDGLVLDWKSLIDFAEKPTQINELLIIGSRSVDDLRHYLDEAEMFNKCEYVLELFDSSYWTISGEDEFLQRLNEKKI